LISSVFSEIGTTLLDAVVPDELPISTPDRKLFDSKHRHHILSEDEFANVLDSSKKKAENLLTQLLFGLEAIYKPALESLTVRT
jgi:hypothetical protein